MSSDMPVESSLSSEDGRGGAGDTGGNVCDGRAWLACLHLVAGRAGPEAKTRGVVPRYSGRHSRRPILAAYLWVLNGLWQEEAGI